MGFFILPQCSEGKRENVFIKKKPNQCIVCEAAKLKFCKLSFFYLAVQLVVWKLSFSSPHLTCHTMQMCSPLPLEKKEKGMEDADTAAWIKRCPVKLQSVTH